MSEESKRFKMRYEAGASIMDLVAETTATNTPRSETFIKMAILAEGGKIRTWKQAQRVVKRKPKEYYQGK